MRRLVLFATLIMSMLACNSDDDSSCTGIQTLIFEIETLNDLASPNLELGQSFMVNIVNTEIMNSIADQGSTNVLKFDRMSAVTFKEYSDSTLNFTEQPSALDAFDYEIVKGAERNVQFSSIIGETRGHTIFLRPQIENQEQRITLKLTPKLVGEFFIFFQDGTELENIMFGDNDNNGCPDEVGFRHRNVSNNDFGFLEGEIQNPNNPLGNMFERWGGIIINVVN